jgi:hypothetical protein
MLKSELTTEFPVDVVFTWIDGADPKVRNIKNVWLQKTTVGSVSVPLHSSDVAQYRWNNHDELKFAIRSIYQFAPWIRRIFVITSHQQTPQFIKQYERVDKEEKTEDKATAEKADSSTGPTVCLVNDTVIFTGECSTHLPVFNSQSIESHLHEIPGLAEHFLYFCDDMLFGRTVEKSDFFTKEGKALVYLSQLPLARKELTGRTEGYIASRIQTKELLRKHRIIPPRPHQPRDLLHQCKPMRKSIFELAWKDPRFRPSLLQTSASKFRTINNIEILSFMAYLGIQQGSFRQAPRSISNMFVPIDQRSEKQFIRHLKQVMKASPKLLCFNESYNCVKGYYLAVERVLNKICPRKAAFEEEQSAPLPLIKTQNPKGSSKKQAAKKSVHFAMDAGADAEKPKDDDNKAEKKVDMEDSREMEEKDDSESSSEEEEKVENFMSPAWLQWIRAMQRPVSFHGEFPLAKKMACPTNLQRADNDCLLVDVLFLASSSSTAQLASPPPPPPPVTVSSAHPIIYRVVVVSSSDDTKSQEHRSSQFPSHQKFSEDTYVYPAYMHQFRCLLLYEKKNQQRVATLEQVTSRPLTRRPGEEKKTTKKMTVASDVSRQIHERIQTTRIGREQPPLLTSTLLTPTRTRHVYIQRVAGRSQMVYLPALSPIPRC